MRNNYLVLFLFVGLFISCGNDPEQAGTDPAVQFATDIQLIKDYLTSNNITAEETDSGLHYVIDTQGSRDFIGSNSQVNVLLTGYFLSGDSFDRTGDCSPVTVSLSNLIPGIREGLQLFNVGGKGSLYLPSVLGFGQNGNEAIPANSVLAFDIEIVDQKLFDQTKIQSYLSQDEIISHIADNQFNLDTTLSGIYYWLEASGQGESPKSTSTITVVYKGYYSDGSTFDQANTPATFKLNEVIRGWQEALKLMKPGARGTFLIPSDLGYGQEGKFEIPGNTMLIFDIELIEFRDE